MSYSISCVAVEKKMKILKIKPSTIN